MFGFLSVRRGGLGEDLLFVQMNCHQLKTSCQYLNICYEIFLFVSERHGVFDFLLHQQKHRNINLKSFTSELTPKVILFLNPYRYIHAGQFSHSVQEK